MIKKIRALFTINKAQKEMEVRKAIITHNKVLLKPTGSYKTVTITPEKVDIIIDELNNISEDCFRVTDNTSTHPYNKLNKELKQNDSKTDTNIKDNMNDIPELNNDDLQRLTKPFEESIYKKKTISLSLYPDEYEMISDMITSNGYKRTEFLLACVSASKKQRFMAEYNRYTKEHKLRRIEEREAARIAREEFIRRN